jgi:hypothetical protein
LIRIEVKEREYGILEENGIMTPVPCRTSGYLLTPGRFISILSIIILKDT